MFVYACNRVDKDEKFCSRDNIHTQPYQISKEIPLLIQRHPTIPLEHIENVYPKDVQLLRLDAVI